MIDYPSANKPLEYDSKCIFYEDYLHLDGEKYPYSELGLILYYNEEKYMNGVKLNGKILMMLFFLKNNILPCPPKENDFSGYAEFNFERGLIPTGLKQGKKLEVIHQFLSKKTFESRLKLIIASLQTRGCFSFTEGTQIFYDNGDVYDNGKLQGNFRERLSADKLIDGEKYGGYSNKVNNPFVYGFEKGTKFFGLMADNFVFNNVTNRDVMKVLLHNLYKNGKMSSF
ncbi:hypothetical protein ACX0HA_12385 [Flavobacterium hauense]